MSELKKYYAKIAFKLHIQTRVIIVSLLVLIFFQPSVAGQVQKADTTGKASMVVQPDAVLNAVHVKDTLDKRLKVSKDAVDKTIFYKTSEKGKIITDIADRKVILIDGGDVTYGDIELKADSIVLDMLTGSVFAAGRPDSTGKVSGTPVFSQGSQKFESREMTYNFKTKKAYIKNIKTEQEGGYLNSSTAKMNPDKTVFVDHSTYSTCDAEDPHFYIALRKAKFYPGEKIVSGPAYLVVLGIPLPVIIPYGFFPIQSKKSSGFLMPSFGQENSRGYYVSDGGFYFAGNDHFDLKIIGSMYTNGSWNSTISSTYKVRYKYSGKFGFSFANNVSGYKGMSTYSKSNNYKINWNHTKDPKSSPNSTFSANVNMSSTSYDKENSYNINDQNMTTRQSGVSYSKSWPGTVPVNFSTSFNHTQNNSTGVVSMTLPTGSFSVSRFYPFKSKNSVKDRWYNDIELQYTAKFRNDINTYDSLMFKKETWKRMNNGFEQDIPVTIPIRPFSNFNISPSLTYSGVVYSREILRRWDPKHYNPDVDSIVPSVVNDTINGFFYGHAIKPSISASYSPSLYGTYTFTKPGSKIEKIRHVIKPSVGFSYTPAFPGLSSRKMFRTVQTSDTTSAKYSVFDGNVYGAPSAPTRAGSVSFRLDNILEAKLASSDTTGKPQKIKFFDNLSASTNYNIFAKTFKWSPVSARFQTTIAKNISFGLNGTFNLYAIDSLGVAYNKFAFSQGQGLARMTSFTMSLSFDLGQLLNGEGKSGTTGQKTGISQGPANKAPGGARDESAGQASLYDEFGYAVFDVPWSMRVNYSYTYSKPGLRPTARSTFNVTGSVKLTARTAMSYTSGYDFREKTISNTNISISRDLHCWEMMVTWIPVGAYKSWNFTIRPKAGILQDLKYERRRDRHETY